MSRKWIALSVGCCVVLALKLLALRDAITPVPFWMMLPGIMAGAICSDSGFDPEGDVHPWGAISTTVMYAVNLALYSGISYGILAFADIPRTPVISRDLPPNPVG
ncbi:MAG: hypothetical protein M3O31_02945 [Acidobacteriota bacterium]|nr:hypothetical protein [Acidobacteriota bacterium]